MTFRPVWGVVVLAGAVLVAAGAGAALALTRPDAPASLQPGTEPTAIAVFTQQFDDSRQVAFKPVVGASRTLASPRAGTVTRTSCTTGKTLESGTVPLTVDDKPVILFHTAYPLYRDITWGMKGSDVQAAQDELARLGYRPDIDGTWARTSWNAWRQFLVDRGLTNPQGTLTRTDLIWLREQQVSPTACPPRPGTAVGVGTTVLTVGGGITSLQMTTTPTSLTEGKRVAAFGEDSGPVDDRGRVTDQTFLTAVQASEAFRAWKVSKGDMPLTLDYRLAEPLEVLAVPAGALYGVAEQAGCLDADDGAAHPVRIVSSSLGSTYVQLLDGATPTQVRLAADADRSGSGRSCT